MNAIDRYPENVQGDFYVLNQACISCGAPQAEAPDLIEHSKLEYGHCYFKKQPETQEEIERAIDAMNVSCIAGIRYGGKDEKILKRLYERGEADQCDYEPISSYKMLVWTKVTYIYNGTIQELSSNLTAQIVSEQFYPNKRIVDYKTNDRNYFEITYTWADRLSGIIYNCTFDSDRLCTIELNNEKEIENDNEKACNLNAIRWNSINLNTILCNDQNVSKIVWFDIDGNIYDKTDVR
ncbi:MAG: ferredoxin [Ignavibacteria bacterium]|nr:ferredoxin [Ignavibacteria bacterium]